jgi:tripartite-type tricarboxylate transporter receptor subunit TctC
MWWGIMVPARTPQPVLQKLNRDIRQALEAGSVPQRFADLGMEVRVSAPAEFAGIVGADIRKWSGIIKEAKLDPGGLR